MIELRNLKAGYGKNVVLKNINLSIKKGEFVVILGRNGAGKTTLLKTISNFIKPVEGEVFLEEKNIKEFSLKAISKKFSYISSNFNTEFPYKVFEIVLMGRIPYLKGLWETEKDLEKTEEIINFLNLEKIKDKAFLELSSGERQKVLLAQSLCKEPEIYLLDEPNIHLDVKETDFLFNVIREENEKGKTIISVLHDINLALNYGSRFIFLKNGEIFYDGKEIKKEILKEIFQLEFEIFNLKDKNFIFPLSRESGKV